MKYVSFVGQVSGFRKQRGELFIQSCVVVILEAESELPAKVYEEFLDEVGLPRKSSTYRKARAVANAASRLLAVSHLLPDSRSAIYELSILDEETFAALVQDGLTSSITAEQIRKKASVKDQKKASDKCVFSVDATPLSHEERLSLVKALREVASRASATVRVPKSIQGMEERA